MDIKDVKKIVDDLQNKPFLCSKEAIETDSGYVITHKCRLQRLAARSLLSINLVLS